jgi:hypothetical protein
VLLFGALSASLLSPPRRLPSMNPPIDVALVGPDQVAPDPVPEAAAPAPAPALQPDIAPPPPEPVPAPPQPKAAERTAEKAKPAERAPPRQDAKRTSKVAGLGQQLGDAARRESSATNGKGTTKGDKGTPAAKTGAEIRRTISVSINAEVRGPWNACRVSGVDIDQLVTTVIFRLNQDGTLGGFSSVRTEGVNESNRFQQARFEECAKNAIVRAAPFDLPREDYAYWKSYTLDFSKR